MFAIDELVGENAWCTTIAYWLCALSPKAQIEGTGALALAGIMAEQYGTEEQAGETGALFPPDATWLGDFNPLAPVQLANRWSPADAAIEALGSPWWQDSETDSSGIRAVALAWAASRFAGLTRLKVKRGAGDRRRFVDLLDLGCFRAMERRTGLLLVLKPGWSYDKAPVFSERTRMMMARANFGVLDRRVPLSAAPNYPSEVVSQEESS